MRRVSNLKELQVIQTNVLYDLTEFCNRNNIKFYLLGGTLIGAVRHKGYIPWDDDMDIAMSRPEYEKLVKLSKGGVSDRCSVLAPEANKEYRGYIPQVVYDKSRLVSRQYRIEEQLKIGISIFVYDGIPNNRIVRKVYYYQMYITRAFHALCRANFKNAGSRSARLIGPLLAPFIKQTNVFRYRDRVLSRQKKYSYEKSTMVSPNADTRSFLEDVEKQQFETEVYIEFEGIRCKVFSHYDEHLTKYYGDYMQLPPVEQQEGKHSFDACIEENFENRLM